MKATKQSKKIVTYYRVSTTKQGLGIEAQKAAVADYLNNHPELIEIGSFTETFTGKEANRPEFSKAVDLCKRSGATLVAAKLDRLGRGKFLYCLLGDSSINFKALDIAGESELERSIRVAVAIEERNLISARTSDAKLAKNNLLREAKAAYLAGDIAGAQRLIDRAQAKSRKVYTLEEYAAKDFRDNGTHAHTEAEREKKAEFLRDKAKNSEVNKRVEKAIDDYLKAGGKRSYNGIAKYLNDNNYKTRYERNGKEAKWSAQSVKNLMLRCGL